MNKEFSKPKMAQMARKLVLGVLGTTAAAIVLVPGLVLADPLHLTKDCTQLITGGGPAGGYCIITQTNIPNLIPVNSKLFYDSGFGAIPNLLDSSVMLYVGAGDWARGRCTFDDLTGNGLCTLSKGMGNLAEVSADLAVSYIGGFSFSVVGNLSFAGNQQ